jgi:hypothetical protein
MRFFGDAASKILWGLVIVLAIAAGMAWFVRAFLQPPDLSASQSNLPAPVTTPNDQTTTPETTTSTNSDPSQVSTTDTSTTTTTTDSSTTTAPDTATTPGTETLPAIAQAEDVAVKVPNKVEKGGILKLFTNNDGNEYPDPIQYSPEKILKTNGLSLVGIGERGKFQEVSGYFLVEETGNYNFVVDYPESWYWAREKANFRLKVDGQTLPTSKGGRLSLEKGWHTISLFLYAYRIDGNLARVSWGREGETLKPIVIWREVEEKAATAKPSQTSEPSVASKEKDAKPSPDASISKTQEGQ